MRISTFFFFWIVTFLLPFDFRAQDPMTLISQVKKAQEKVRHIYYKAERQDTLVMGTVRSMTGEVKLSSLPADSIFGFRCWAKRDGLNMESIYDGQAAFFINHELQTYEIFHDPVMIEAITGKPGGQLLMPDLVRIDTGKARDFELVEEKDYYFLKILYPDIERYDVRQRSKTLTIDKKLLLPVAARFHQVTLDKVQDLYFKVTELKINEPSLIYDFTSLRYPEHYKPEEEYSNKTLYGMLGKSFSGLSVSMLNGTTMNILLPKGKLILLDFWELWCGPCVASLPKVQELNNKYGSQGLEIYGVMQEAESIPAAKRLVEKFKLDFPMGVGAKGYKDQLSIKAVPVYMLIDKEGKIVFISEGFSDQIEEEIRKHI